tara:strand:- start:676 stop:1386 length:711 start_codon:yes stop_codon:yes gene_type:complete
MNTIYSITNEDLIKLKESRTPTLIKNGLKYFPKLKKWNKDYIIEKYGELTCWYSNDARPAYYNLTTTYKEFFNNLSNENYTFTRKPRLSRLKKDSGLVNNPNTDNNDFIQDLTFPNPLFTELEIRFLQFFAGPKKSGALPHAHGQVLNIMVYGRKKWIFFDGEADVAKNLVDGYAKNYPTKSQWGDWYDSEYSNLTSVIPVIECIQEQDDIVFIPKNYVHTVLNLQDTMGVVIEIF